LLSTSTGRNAGVADAVRPVRNQGDMIILGNAAGEGVQRPSSAAVRR
jgi:hypothetical protein